MKKREFILGCMLLIFFASCNKKKSPTKTELLTTNPWKITEYTVNPPKNINGVVVSDVYSIMKNCWKDNLYYFNSDHSYAELEGSTKCDSQDPDTIAKGIWAFNDDETMIIGNLDGGGEPPIVPILELASSTLKSGESLVMPISELTSSTLKSSIVDEEDGVIYTFRITFSSVED